MLTRLDKKLDRLNQMEQLLLTHTEGLIKAEIARRIGVNRSEMDTYLADLGKRFPIYEPAPGRYAINRDLYEGIHVQLNLHEALALHLAARLLTTCTDKYNPNAATLLRKLSGELKKIAPLISKHVELSADVLDDSSRRRDPAFVHVLKTLTQSWSRGVKVRLTHQKEDNKISEHVFAPYFIEPYAVGRAVHVIGKRDSDGAIRTFKVERIRTIEILDEATYVIPDTFDPREELKDAWGIWFTDAPPQHIELKFSRRVAARVLETKWHHSDDTKDLEDGSLLWWADVADWKEMLHWIRGWGSDCVAISPPGLRKAVGEDMRRAGELYDDEMMTR